jgi:integrase
MGKVNQYGVRRRGKRYIAKPYVPGHGHVWAGTYDSHAEATAAAIAKIEETKTLPANKETVGSFVERWIRDYPRAKESTNDRYKADAERFAKEFGPRKLHQVTVPEARRYALNRRHDLGALRAMYSDARKEGLVRENPFSELGIPKGPGRRNIVAITSEELDRIIDLAGAAHHGEFALRFQALIRFAAETTMRPGEICGLDRPDVDFEAETVWVRRQFHKRRIQLPKNGKPRKLPFLPPRAAAAILGMPRLLPRPLCDVTGGEILFPGKHAQRITASALSGYWKPVRVAFEAGLAPERRVELVDPGKGALDLYALRHFGATQMVERGVESWIVARMMGHEDGGRLVERVYGHPRDDVARERLRRAFAQNVEPLRSVDNSEEATG